MQCYFWKYGFWFYLFGWNVQISLKTKHIPLFSERYGYKKARYFGPFRIETSKSIKPRTNLQLAILRAICGAVAVIVALLAYTVIMFNFVRWIAES